MASYRVRFVMACGLLLSLLTGNAGAVELRQVISREHPAIQGTGAGLAIGRDGFVYIYGGQQNTGYVLRVGRDGSQKFGMPTTYAVTGVAANADGITATSNAHFAKSVNVYGRLGESLGTVGGFTGNDNVGWDGPGAIEVGSSSDFFSLDQYANRVVRVSPDAKIVRSYPIQAESEPDPRRLWRYGFRVCEAREQLYFIVDQHVVCRGFDGRDRWFAPSQVAGDLWGGFRGGFDVDGEGRLYLNDGFSPVVRILDADGQPIGEVTLQMGAREAGPQRRISHLRVFADDIIVRQPSDTEIFQVYDRSSGAFRRAVGIESESLTVAYPSSVWTAGSRIPFSVSFARETGGEAAGAAEPMVTAWLRPLGTVRFDRLPVSDGQVAVPQDASGLFQLRVSSGLNGSPSEYQVETVVEIRPENAVGSLSILTPLNRRSYAQGETIPFSVVGRTLETQSLPEAVDVKLLDADGTEKHRQTVALADASKHSIPAVVTNSLLPGEYRLTTTLPGWTIADQYLEIGGLSPVGPVPTGHAAKPATALSDRPAGIDPAPKFYRVRHGDYSMAFPAAGYFDVPEQVARHLDFTQRLGENLMVDRLGHGGGGGLGEIANVLRDADLTARLQADPIAVAPQKVEFENRILQTIAAYGAAGIEQRAILLYMDAGLPVGTGFDKRSNDEMQRDIAQVTGQLRDYPAFGGWSWAANWWIAQRGAALAATPAEKTQYEAAFKAAQNTGRWDPILDTVSDRWIAHAVDAEKLFRGAMAGARVAGVERSEPPAQSAQRTEGSLHSSTATRDRRNLVSAMTAPYRQPGMIPPLSFANADEVDLHFQAEQIQWPMMSAHNVDFYKRPGKLAWAHPELWNDDGTGGQILSSSLQMLMRGVNGIGQSGSTKGFASTPTDPRGMGPGSTSIHRRLNEWLAERASWLSSLDAADPVVIPVSTRMLRMELGWQGIGGFYFTRLFEAYNACLRAHRPASFVFSEDCQADSLLPYKGVLIVSQTVELDPPLRNALERAASAGVSLFSDATSRPEMLEDLSPRRLDIEFTKLEHEHHLLNDDSVFWRYRNIVLEHAAQLSVAWKGVVPPVAECGHPELLLTERRSGDARVLWAVNDSAVPLEPAQLWRVSLAAGSRFPVLTELDWPAAEGCDVFELFSGKQVDADKPLPVDLCHAPARVFVAVPRDVRRTSQSVAAEKEPTDWKSSVRAAEQNRPEPFAARLRDVVVSSDQQTALVTAAGWDRNAFFVDVETGAVRKQSRIGHHFAYAPQSTSNGFAVQGYDLNSSEGYHLHLFDARLESERRFALYGLPKRGTSWAVARQMQEAINNFAVSPDGTWVASAGDLGLVVCSRDGGKLWSEDWWRDSRQRRKLLAVDSQTLLTMNGFVVTAHNARTGEKRWSHELGKTGELTQALASRDGGLIALVSTDRGGRIFILRDGKPAHELPTSADDATLSPDGRFIAVTQDAELRLFDTNSGLLWSVQADDVLRSPRFSADGSRIVAGSEIGTLYVFSVDGERVLDRDLGALPVASWLGDGGLLVATWLGSISRLDTGFQPKWETTLQSDEESLVRRTSQSVAAGESTDWKSVVLTRDGTPTVRVTGWGNTAPEVAPLTPNLLAETQALIEARCEPATHGDPRTWQHDVNLLRDGKPDAPEKPWLESTDISYLDSGWRQKLVVQIDTFRSQLRVDGVTIIEDPAHPESWTRDMRLQWWDADAEAWRDGPYLLSDQARHTHWFDQPLHAAKFRFVSTGGASWPVGNIRWGELVFHGEVLGPSHPDAVANRPLAVLFDEREDDLKHLMAYGSYPFAFRYDDASSGGKSLSLKSAGNTTANWRPPFGHVLPNWDFQIVEEPAKPGEYRWLEFAWKSASAKTTGVTLRLGPHHGGGVSISSGEPTRFEGAVAVQHSDKPPGEWSTVRVDLRKLHGKPFSIRSLSLGSEGDGALFDRIVLGRSESDLER